MPRLAGAPPARRTLDSHLLTLDGQQRSPVMHVGVEGMGAEQRGAVVAPSGHEQVGLHTQCCEIDTEDGQIFCLSRFG